MAIKFHWMYRHGWEPDTEGLVQMAKDLESANIESVLLPYGPRGIDFSVHLHLILSSTKKIRMMLALPAYAVTPEYVAKTFKSINNFSHKRIDLNLVAGRYGQPQEDMVIDAYPGDISLIDEHDKRVVLTEPWIEKFTDLMKDFAFEARLCVVGSSETTIRIANKYTDYIIVGDYMLNDHYLPQITNSKLMLIIDPLVLKENQEESLIEYNNHSHTKVRQHTIKGNHEEVVKQIKQISQDFNVNDFIVVTDQKDLSGIFSVIQDLTVSTK